MQAWASGASNNPRCSNARKNATMTCRRSRCWPIRSTASSATSRGLPFSAMDRIVGRSAVGVRSCGLRIALCTLDPIANSPRATRCWSLMGSLAALRRADGSPASRTTTSGSSSPLAIRLRIGSRPSLTELKSSPRRSNSATTNASLSRFSAVTDNSRTSSSRRYSVVCC